MMQQEQHPTFEQVYAELQQTVEQLEAGGISLEEATRLFDQGMHLARACNEMLAAAELRISRLRQTMAEQLDLTDQGSVPYAGGDDRVTAGGTP